MDTTPGGPRMIESSHVPLDPAAKLHSVGLESGRLIYSVTKPSTVKWLTEKDSWNGLEAGLTSPTGNDKPIARQETESRDVQTASKPSHKHEGTTGGRVSEWTTGNRSRSPRIGVPEIWKECSQQQSQNLSDDRSNLSVRITSPPNRRKRVTRSDRGDKEGQSESSSSDRDGQNRKNNGPSTRRKPLRCACPFYIADPDNLVYSKGEEYSLCRTIGVDLSKLKEHIRRKHTKPAQCEKCGLRGEAGLIRQHQKKKPDCSEPEGGFEKVDSETLEKDEQLKKKKQSWSQVFKIFFPHIDPVPDSEFHPPLAQDNLPLTSQYQYSQETIDLYLRHLTHFAKTSPAILEMFHQSAEFGQFSMYTDETRGIFDHLTRHDVKLLVMPLEKDDLRQVLHTGGALNSDHSIPLGFNNTGGFVERSQVPLNISAGYLHTLPTLIPSASTSSCPVSDRLGIQHDSSSAQSATCFAGSGGLTNGQSTGIQDDGGVGCPDWEDFLVSNFSSLSSERASSLEVSN